MAWLVGLAFASLCAAYYFVCAPQLREDVIVRHCFQAVSAGVKDQSVKEQLEKSVIRLDP